MLKNLLVVSLVLGLIFSFPVMASAQQFETEASENISIFGGSSFTTFADEGFEDENINLSSGFGFFGGGKYNLTEQLSLIGQYDKYNAGDSIENINYNFTLNSLSGLGAFNLLNSEEPLSISVKSGLGYYFGEMKATSQGISFTLDLENNLGFKFGGAMEYKITPNMSLSGNGYYRTLYMGLEDEFDGSRKADLSGLEVNTALTYTF